MRGLVLISLGLSVLLVACGDDAVDPPSDQADGAPAATFVGRGRCAVCHADEDALWQGSHHDLAMQPATKKNVLGDFSDQKLEHFGTTSTMFERDGKFWVNTDGPDGEFTDFEVAYAFGVTPLQQYLVKFPGGRMQSLPLCWDTRPKDDGGQRWYHLYQDEAIPHTDILHWTGPNQNWNFMCADCHSTGLSRNYDLERDSFDTQWSEIDVSCEACHGPGSEHVTWSEERAAVGEQGTYDGTAQQMGLVTSLRGLPDARWVIDKETGQAKREGPPPSANQITACARCHARRTMITGDVHGQTLLDKLVPALLREGLYHADGQINDEVYVWGSFAQSKMHAQGVVCTDCHKPHDLGLRSEGNTLCYRCHLPDRFDTKAHHFHEPGTPGAQCVSCHMPSKHYMVVDPRHDHSLRVPRPDLTEKIGTPNACNGCHEDQSAAWATAAIDRWYDKPKRPPHFGEVLHAARNGAADAAARLLALARDPQAAGIVRATATSELGERGDPETLAAVESGSVDPDPLVRLAAARLLSMLPVETRLRIGDPMMDDSVRAVRIEAARRLASIQDGVLSGASLAARERGIAAYVSAQMVNADRAFAHENIGLLRAEQGRLDEAVAAYRTALRLDPNARNAWANLADVHRERGDDDAAVRILRDGLARLPDAPGLHHALGLALVRVKQYRQSLKPLGKAWVLDRGVARHGYMYGVALMSTGQGRQALDVLESVHGEHPTDRDVLQALVTIARDLDDVARALRHARTWQKLDPQDTALQAQIQQLEQRLRGGR
ncbi:MAG: tetratricopeptide repeat protein [Planctomycetes bacterium]|nr:tetratricopeptide repeat protein [Planctomycetota bacterium]